MDALLDEADGILTVLRENAGLSKVMTHPKIVKEEKLDLIDHIFKGRVSDEMVGLMRMIVEKGHFGELESVLEYFIAQVKEYRNIGIAYVTTAMELSDAQKEQITEKLIQTTNMSHLKCIMR